MRKRRWRAASPMPRSSPGIAGGIPSARPAGSAMPMPCWPGARTSARPRWFARRGSKVPSARRSCARPIAATVRCCGGRITSRASTAWCGRTTAARRGACIAMSMRGISFWRRRGSRSARARAGWTGPSSVCRARFATIRGWSTSGCAGAGQRTATTMPTPSCARRRGSSDPGPGSGGGNAPFSCAVRWRTGWPGGPTGWPRVTVRPQPRHTRMRSGSPAGSRFASSTTRAWRSPIS